jgi:hypothetical protein
MEPINKAETSLARTGWGRGWPPFPLPPCDRLPSHPLKGGSGAQPHSSARPRLTGPGGRDITHSDAPTGGNGTPPAEIGEGDVLADPLPDRLDAVWPLLTDTDRLAVVELAERLSVANWDGVKVGG